MSNYLGFSTINNSFGPYSLTGYNLVVQDFLNQLNIRKGDIPHRPIIGCIIWDLLFSPFTPSVENQILTDITRIIKMDPRLSASSTVAVTSFEKGIQLDVELIFSNSNQSSSLKLLFDETQTSAILQ